MDTPACRQAGILKIRIHADKKNGIINGNIDNNKYIAFFVPMYKINKDFLNFISLLRNKL